MSVSREAWLAVVQHGDDAQETEAVTIESVDGRPRMIELTDGTRITLVEPAGGTPDPSARKAAA